MKIVDKFLKMFILLYMRQHLEKIVIWIFINGTMKKF